MKTKHNYDWGTCEIDGNSIKIKYKVVHFDVSFEGRILKDSLDLQWTQVTYETNVRTRLTLFEFVAFSYQ